MTYYDILEISEKASQEVIRMAHKALCKKYHPDTYQGDKNFAEEKIKQINEAYSVLSDELKKKEYDDCLKNQKQSENKEYFEPGQEHKDAYVDNLLKRGFMSLEDGDWIKADCFFEQALNYDAEIAEAYLGKLMIELKIKTRDAFKKCELPFDDKTNYQRAYRFANDSLKTFLIEISQFVEYSRACELFEMGEYSIVSLKEAMSLFEKIRGYKDSEEKIKECHKKIIDNKGESERAAIVLLTTFIIIGIIVILVMLGAL